MYVSWALFDKDFMDTSADFDALHDGQYHIPYDPAERITIARCTDGEWCDGVSQESFYVNTEPETGMVYAFNTHFMISVRIGTRATLLHDFSDALVPVATMHVRAVASSKILGKLAELQGSHGTLNMLVIFSVAGIVVSTLGFLGVVFFFLRKGSATEAKVMT
jgi:hypothetical protein